jgi:hypothetical protein
VQRWAVVKVLSGAPALPKLFAPDKGAARRFIEFFTANIRYPNTGRAYARAAVDFVLWCECTVGAAYGKADRRRIRAYEGRTG